MQELVVSELLLQHLDRKRAASLARQIYQALRELVLAGHMPPGTKLPATRQLATEMALSRNTVTSAYLQLQSEGYVVSIVGSGTFVSDTVSSFGSAAAGATDDYAEVPAHLMLSERGVDLVQNAQASDIQLGAFVPGIPDVSLFPHAVWLRILRRRWRNPDPALFTYAYGAGYLPLRCAVVQHIRLARSVRCDPEQVVLTSGIHQSLHLIACLLGEVGDPAWIENPAYWGARTVLKASGIRTIPVDVDDEGMAPTLAQLRKPPRFMFVTPSHQYPLGTIMSLSRRRMLLEYANRHKIWIIEDDYDSEFRFDGRPIASLQGMDTHGSVIYLGTFSKTMFAGLRLGYMVLPKALAAHFARGLSDLYREGRLIDHAVLADFIKEGHYATHIRRMRHVYARRQALLRDAIHEKFGSGWPISTHEAGLHLVMHLPQGVDDIGIVLAARTMGIVVRPLSRYYVGNSKPGLLFGYAGVPDDQIRPEFQRLAAAIMRALDYEQKYDANREYQGRGC